MPSVNSGLFNINGETTTYQNHGYYMNTLTNVNAIKIKNLSFDSSNIKVFIQKDDKTGGIQNRKLNLDLDDYNILTDDYSIDPTNNLYGSNKLDYPTPNNYYNDPHDENNRNYAYLNPDISGDYVIHFSSIIDIKLTLFIGEDASNLTCNIDIEDISGDTLIINSNSADATNILTDISSNSLSDKRNKLKGSLKNRLFSKELFKFFKINNDILDLKYKFKTYIVMKNATSYNISNLASDEGIYAPLNNNNDFVDLIINNKQVRITRTDISGVLDETIDTYVISNINNATISLSNNDNLTYLVGDEVVIENKLFTFGSAEGGGDVGGGNICFYPGTIISTDQGKMPIEHINPDINTIHNKQITTITRTIYPSNLVCFTKNSLGYNCPNKELIVSDNHLIFYNNTFIQAGDFAANKVKINNLYSSRHSKGIHFVKNNKKILYNILLEEHDVINANNVMCETLHPDNLIAKIHKNTDTTEKNILMTHLNNTNYFKNRLSK